MQNLIIALVVTVAALFLGRRLWRSWRHPGSSCGCGCSGCTDAPRCQDKQGFPPLPR